MLRLEHAAAAARHPSRQNDPQRTALRPPTADELALGDPEYAAELAADPPRLAGLQAAWVAQDREAAAVRRAAAAAVVDPLDRLRGQIIGRGARWLKAQEIAPRPQPPAVHAQAALRAAPRALRNYWQRTFREGGPGSRGLGAACCGGRTVFPPSPTCELRPPTAHFCELGTSRPAGLEAGPNLARSYGCRLVTADGDVELPDHDVPVVVEPLTKAAPPYAIPLPEAPRGVRVRAERLIRTEERQRALRWVSGLDTKGGHARAYRIAWCGQVEVRARESGGEYDISWCPRWCRDRACPACAASRSRSLTAALREYRKRREAVAPMAFVTLTQPKQRCESFSGAYDRLQRAWRRLQRSTAFRELVAGGVKGTEIPWSTPETNPKVKFAGPHAHLHLAWELRPADASPVAVCRFLRALANGCKIDRRTRSQFRWEALRCDPAAAIRFLQAKWIKLVGGHARAQHFKVLTDTNVHQIAKYVTKPFELPERLAPKFFRQMARRRLFDGWGVWRGFRHVADHVESPGGKWLRGPSFSVLQREAARDGEVLIFLDRKPQPTPQELADYVGDLVRLDQLNEFDPGRERRWEPSGDWPQWSRLHVTSDPVVCLSARDVWRALKKDPRLPWERDTS